MISRLKGFSSPLKPRRARRHEVESPIGSTTPLSGIDDSPGPSNFVIASAPPTRRVPLPKRGRGKRKAEGGCTCQTSRCMKLYCVCFANGRYCSDACGCSDCVNDATHEDLLQRIRHSISERNPDAFERQPADGGGTEAVRAGCKCKISKCMKRYCECFRAGVPCSAKCECVGCHNGRESSSSVPALVAAADESAALLDACVDAELGFDALFGPLVSSSSVLVRPHPTLPPPRIAS